MSKFSPTEQFVELLRQSQGQVFGYIFALVQDMEETQDIFQQTSLVLWQKFDSFEGTNFAGWACRTAQFVALNHLRAKRRDRVSFSSEVLAHLTQLACEHEGNDRSRREALEHCLSKLSQADRKLIDGYYVVGQTVKSVAEQLGRSGQSISNSLRRIRRALSDCIRRTLAHEERS
jgi:RNA polymerase sigma-70 factor (ECF subfamily)